MGPPVVSPHPLTRPWTYQPCSLGVYCITRTRKVHVSSFPFRNGRVGNQCGTNKDVGNPSWLRDLGHRLRRPLAGQGDQQPDREVLEGHEDPPRGAERLSLGGMHGKIASALNWLLGISKKLNDSGMYYFLAHNDIVVIENRIRITLNNGCCTFDGKSTEMKLEDFKAVLARLLQGTALRMRSTARARRRRRSPRSWRQWRTSSSAHRAT
jgi:hypothetical protein